MMKKAFIYGVFGPLNLAIVMLLFGVKDAYAGHNFSDIAENIIYSIRDLPSLLTGIAYMLGILFGTLGILKIKDHVESPSNVKLQDGAIRLVAGGALFALPIVMEAMKNTIGQGAGVGAPHLAPVQFN